MGKRRGFSHSLHSLTRFQKQRQKERERRRVNMKSLFAMRAQGQTCKAVDVTSRRSLVQQSVRREAGATVRAQRWSNLSCQAGKGTYNTDFSSTLEYKRHEKDVGSSEYQIARLTTRITQLTDHLKEHKRDHATRRGLMAMLNRRNTLLQYLFKNDRPTYTATIKSLGIRSRLTDKI